MWQCKSRWLVLVSVVVTLCSLQVVGCVLFVPLCQENNDCRQTGYVCISGKCQTCGSDADCKDASKVCRGGACVAGTPSESCTTDADCSHSLFACKQGKCAPRSCTTGADCPPSFPACLLGVCSIGGSGPQTCSSHGDCQPPTPVCEKGKCVAAQDCKSDGDCPSNLPTCQDGVCVTKTPTGGSNTLFFPAQDDAAWGGMAQYGKETLFVSGVFGGVYETSSGGKKHFVAGQSEDAFYAARLSIGPTPSHAWFVKHPKATDAAPSPIVVDRDGNAFFWTGAKSTPYRLWSVKQELSSSSAPLTPTSQKVTTMSIYGASGNSWTLQHLVASAGLPGFFLGAGWAGTLTFEGPSKESFTNDKWRGKSAVVSIYGGSTLDFRQKKPDVPQLFGDDVLAIRRVAVYAKGIDGKTLFVLGSIKSQALATPGPPNPFDAASSRTIAFVAAWELVSSGTSSFRGLTFLPGFDPRSLYGFAALDNKTFLITGGTDVELDKGCFRGGSPRKQPFFFVAKGFIDKNQSEACQLLLQAVPKADVDATSKGRGIFVKSQQEIAIVGDWKGTQEIKNRRETFPTLPEDGKGTSNVFLWVIDAAGSTKANMMSISGNNDITAGDVIVTDSMYIVGGMSLPGTFEAPGVSNRTMASSYLFVWMHPK